jgi:hypothetical protein
MRVTCRLPGRFRLKLPSPVEVTVTRETGTGDGFRTLYLLHFPAGRGRDKNCNDISVYHDAPSAVITINSSLPFAMDS